MDQSTIAVTPIPEAPFVACFGVPVRPDGTIASSGPDVRCACCCHWSHPLTVTPREHATGVVVPLFFTEWIVYAWHVQYHQRGVPLA